MAQLIPAPLFDLSDFEVPKPNRRNFNFDFVYTDTSKKGLCCTAIQAGLKYGIQSGFNPCTRVNEFSGRHRVTFVDCNYKKYDHKKHLRTVKELEPRYATVRDIMSTKQCEAALIKYFPFEQIMEWACELAEYAKNVILIPKIDIIDEIPTSFMLGYSIPTSHGGTTIPIERFCNHRVHLLGGSWKDQLSFIKKYNFVVSCDNNMLNKRAIYGKFVYPDGNIGDLGKDFNLYPGNHWFVAATLSFGNIAQKLYEIFGERNNA